MNIVRSITRLFYFYHVLFTSTQPRVFTGIIMEPGKKYSTVVENTFHLSMAALDLDTVKKGMYSGAPINCLF